MSSRISISFLLCFCLIICNIAFAQNAITIKGRVVSETQKALSSITVSLQTENGRQRTKTDNKGEFIFKEIKKNPQEIIFSSSSHKKKTIQLYHLQNDTTLLITLNEKLNELDGVDVYGRNGSYNSKEISSSLRLQTPILNIPQNISVITNKIFEVQQITTLSDGVIRNIAGAQRIEHWGDLYTRFNMRGGRAAAFLNGINVTSNWGPLSEDMSYVDRIEVVKGPAGFMMSNGEPSGIYNIVTKKPTGMKALQGYARFTTGSFGMYRGEADIDSKLSEKVSFRLNVMGQDKKSFRDYEFNNRFMVNPSVKFNLSKNTDLTAEYIYQHAKMSQVGSAYVFTFDGYGTKPVNYTLSDPNIAPTNVKDQTANLNFQHSFNDRWKITAQGSYLNTYTLGSDIWPAMFEKSNNKMIRSLFFWEASNVMKFGQVFVNGAAQTGKISHKFLSGFDYGNKKYLADWRQGGNIDKFNALGNSSSENSVADFNYWYNLNTNNYDNNTSNYTISNNGYPTFDGVSKTLTARATPGGTIVQKYAGIYLQDEIGFFKDNLRLTLAGRYTYVTQSAYGGNDETANKITPRVGLNYSINQNTSVYGLFDQSFVPQVGFFRDGSKVSPKTGNNLEFGVKKDWMEGKLNTSFSIYRILNKNGITADPTNAPNESFMIILGKTRTKGLEFDIKGQMSENINLVFNYALTENKVIDSNSPLYKVGDKVAGYATHVANAWINYTLLNGVLKGLSFNFGGTFMAGRSTWNWGSTTSPLELNNYLKFDAGSSWENKKIRITLNIFNVFSNYLYSGSGYNFTQADGTRAGGYYYQAEAPRNIRLSVGYKF